LTKKSYLHHWEVLVLFSTVLSELAYIRPTVLPGPLNRLPYHGHKMNKAGVVHLQKFLNICTVWGWRGYGAVDLNL